MNKDNPYRSSVHPDAHEEIPAEQQMRLRKIASAQRHVTFAVLFYFLFIGAIIALPALAQNVPWAGMAVAILGVCLMVYGTLSVYRLTAILRGSIRAIISVVGFIIPILGLLILLSVNREATSILQRHRIKVGLLGANPSTL